MKSTCYARVLVLLTQTITVTGCADSNLRQSGYLSSYDNLIPANGILTKAVLRIDGASVASAKTVKIVPTVFSAPETRGSEISPEQKKLIANAIDRALCVGLSDRFEMVLPEQAADLTVRAAVTELTPTDEFFAGLSKVASTVPSVFSLGAPVPVPRIPIGLGSLSVESEARDGKGVQKAALIWARGADSVTSSPKMSRSGDAYDLASAFGSDFSQLLSTGQNPFQGLPPLPTMQKIGSALGGGHKYKACELFGRSPGVGGLIGSGLALPPEWTDTAKP